MNKIKLALLLMLAASNPAWSMDWQASNSLGNVRIDSAGSIYGNTTNVLNQTTCPVTVFAIPSTQAGLDPMLSILLTALAAQKNIQLSIASCPVGGPAIIDGVRINK